MTFIIDSQVYHTFVNRGASFAAWPFDQRFYLLLNLAVGGNWAVKWGSTIPFDLNDSKSIMSGCINSDK